MPFDYVPPDVILVIISYGSLLDSWSLRMTCRHLRDVIRAHAPKTLLDAMYNHLQDVHFVMPPDLNADGSPIVAFNKMYAYKHFAIWDKGNKPFFLSKGDKESNTTASGITWLIFSKSCKMPLNNASMRTDLKNAMYPKNGRFSTERSNALCNAAKCLLEKNLSVKVCLVCNGFEFQMPDLSFIYRRRSPESPR